MDSRYRPELLVVSISKNNPIKQSKLITEYEKLCGVTQGRQKSGNNFRISQEDIAKRKCGQHKSKVKNPLTVDMATLERFYVFYAIRIGRINRNRHKHKFLNEKTI